MKRTQFLEEIALGFKVNPVVAILGPRQAGKTTLARQYIDSFKQEGKQLNLQVHYFDLENPDDLAALQTPKTVLENLKGLIVIDEIQRIKEIFPIIRVLADRVQSGQQYLVLGSASQDLIRQSSESLAGRISYIELMPFGYNEVKEIDKLWLRGGFPKSFLAEADDLSMRWRIDYIRTFLERDIPNLGIRIPAENLRRFWLMLCNNHGSILNASEIGKSLSITHTTVRTYVDILVGTFMVRQLSPWFENISKRQVKSPKIYIRDSGILHALLQLPSKEVLIRHMKLGASWEGFALEEVIRSHELYSNHCYFWATQNNAELDLFFMQNGKRYGYEFKFTDSPKITKSLMIAIDDLKLDKAYVIYPGNKQFQVRDNVEFCGLERYLSLRQNA